MQCTYTGVEFEQLRGAGGTIADVLRLVEHRRVCVERRLVDVLCERSRIQLLVVCLLNLL